MSASAKLRPSGVISTSPSLSGEAEQHASLDDRQQIVDIHDEFFGQAVQIFLAAAVRQQFQQAGDAADAGVRQHLILLARSVFAQFAAAKPVRQRELEVGLGHDLVNVVHEFDKARRLAVAGLRNVDREIGANAGRDSCRAR